MLERGNIESVNLGIFDFGMFGMCILNMGICGSVGSENRNLKLWECWNVGILKPGMWVWECWNLECWECWNVCILTLGICGSGDLRIW